MSALFEDKHELMLTKFQRVGLGPTAKWGWRPHFAWHPYSLVGMLLE
jgi:hypothetical protein